MGTIKDRNGKDLIEAEEIKKRWQEYTELYKKVLKKLKKKKHRKLSFLLNDPDNHDGVVTHPQPDIVECEVKWALGSITMNKARRGDGIPAELFQILKDDSVKSYTQYVSESGKFSSGHRTGKGQFPFQPQRKEMPRNVQTTTQLDSFHMLKILQARLHQYMN